MLFQKMLNFSLQTFLNLNNFIIASIPQGKYRIQNEFLSYKWAQVYSLKKKRGQDKFEEVKGTCKIREKTNIMWERSMDGDARMEMTEL